MLAAAAACAPGWYGKGSACGASALMLAGLWVLADANRWVLVFILSAWLLPPLPVPLGDSGPHVALLAAMMGLIAGVLRIHAWRFRADWFTAVAIALPAVFACSSVVAGLTAGAAAATGSLTRVALFAISIFTFFYVRSGPFDVGARRLRALLRVFAFGAMASAAFACVDFYFQFPAPSGFAAQFIWLSSGIYRRAQGVFYEASTLANLCAFALSLIAVCLFSPREVCPAPKWLLGLAAIPLCGALVLSYSRASVLALAVALAALCWLRRERFPIRRLAMLGAVFCLAPAAILVNTVPKFAETYWLRLYRSFTYFGSSPDSILSGRVRSWESLFSLIAEHPWQVLLGIGFRNLAVSPLGGAPIIADNTYLSSLVETGAIGLGLVLTWNWLILRRSYQASQAAAPYRRLFGTWMFCFWAGEMAQMFSGDLLTYWRLLPAFFAVFALTLRVEC